MTSFRQKLKSKLGEFASILQVGNFLYKNYLSRSLIAVILSFFFMSFRNHRCFNDNTSFFDNFWRKTR